MLKGIPSIIPPELMKILMEMGHGDELLICDGNYPKFGCPERCVRMDGHGIPEGCDGIVINAGAYTHTSVALQDCIRSLKCPVIEVHISNVHKREAFRHQSMISCACLGVICGFGLDSYRLAIEALIDNAARAKAE